ncbi:CLUMA_CG017120, isoform A [Clunio marinus]|uniref:CLUMA_CG017120, isoform A n=1 Tax=Clunio marinus TaxID=568069 RepID=A0A1J1IWD3_9DIPT|nr:CLUMA_CG017120, isoform A [Clunio marinus]
MERKEKRHLTKLELCRVMMKIKGEYEKCVLTKLQRHFEIISHIIHRVTTEKRKSIPYPYNPRREELSGENSLVCIHFIQKNYIDQDRKSAVYKKALKVASNEQKTSLPQQRSRGQSRRIEASIVVSDTSNDNTQVIITAVTKTATTSSTVQSVVKTQNPPSTSVSQSTSGVMTGKSDTDTLIQDEEL